MKYILAVLVCCVSCSMGSPISVPLRQAVEVVGGIGEFVNGIRSAFGRSHEFANQNGFDYSNVYNSILQYSAMNSYLEKQNQEILQTQLAETAIMRQESAPDNLRETIILCVFLSVLTLSSIGGICSDC